MSLPFVHSHSGPAPKNRLLWPFIGLFVFSCLQMLSKSPCCWERCLRLDRIHIIYGGLRNQSHIWNWLRKCLLSSESYTFGVVVDLLEFDNNLVPSFQQMRIPKFYTQFYGNHRLPKTLHEPVTKSHWLRDKRKNGFRLLSADYVPGTTLNTWYALSHLIHAVTLWGKYTYYFTAQRW